MDIRGAGRTAVKAAREFLDDDAMMLAAAVSFYTALSMAPLLILFLGVAGLLGPESQQGLVDQIHRVIGPQAARAVQMVVDHAASDRNGGLISTIIGGAALLFGATTLFAQLQKAMNRIWDVQVRPGMGLWGWARKRLMSLGMILAVGFLLAVSLVLSALLAMILPVGGWGPQAIHFAVSLLVVTLLFALIYRVLPDVHIAWRDVWGGSALTALLFTAGKLVIGLYLGRSTVGSSYGAAGSLIVLLIWVHYAAVILFYGAEVTQVYARRAGRGIEPENHAVRTGGPAACGTARRT
jgi:membrane protein